MFREVIYIMPTKKVSTGITRFDLHDRNIYGFMVRMCRKGEHFQQFFSDSRYGGKRKAKKCADDYYAELYEKHGPAESGTRNKMTSRNSSGHVGVHLAQTIDKTDPDYAYHAYCASWVGENGSRGKINFSFNKYGEKDAFEMACLARKLECSDRKTIELKYSRSVARKKNGSRKTKKR